MTQDVSRVVVPNIQGANTAIPNTTAPDTASILRYPLDSFIIT